MSITTSYNKDYNFLLTRVSGSLNDAELLEHVNKLNRELAGLTGLRELADCRTLKDVSGLTVEGTTNCARMENDMPGSRLAILVPDGNLTIYGMARAYQMFSEDHREAVQIFTDLRESIEWLGFSEADVMDIIRAVNKA